MVAIAVISLTLGLIVMICSIIAAKNAAECRRCAENADKNIKSISNTTGNIYRYIDEIDTTVRNIKSTTDKISSHKDDVSIKKIDSLERAVGAVCYGMSENTYKLLLDLISAVDANDVDKLSAVVRTAQHMCKQYKNTESQLKG